MAIGLNTAQWRSATSGLRPRRNSLSQKADISSSVRMLLEDGAYLVLGQLEGNSGRRVDELLTDQTHDRGTLAGASRSLTGAVRIGESNCTTLRAATSVFPEPAQANALARQGPMRAGRRPAGAGNSKQTKRLLEQSTERAGAMLRGGRKRTSWKLGRRAVAPAVGKDNAVRLQSFPSSLWDGLGRA